MSLIFNKYGLNNNQDTIYHNKMGIPSYFKYVVQKHRNILKKYTSSLQKDNFYMDCNSVIYDCVRELPKNCSNIESELVKRTCKNRRIYTDDITRKEFYSI